MSCMLQSKARYVVRKIENLCAKCNLLHSIVNKKTTIAVWRMIEARMPVNIWRIHKTYYWLHTMRASQRRQYDEDDAYINYTPELCKTRHKDIVLLKFS